MAAASPEIFTIVLQFHRLSVCCFHTASKAMVSSIDGRSTVLPQIADDGLCCCCRSSSSGVLGKWPRSVNSLRSKN